MIKHKLLKITASVTLFAFAFSNSIGYSEVRAVPLGTVPQEPASTVRDLSAVFTDVRSELRQFAEKYQDQNFLPKLQVASRSELRQSNQIGTASASRAIRSMSVPTDNGTSEPNLNRKIGTVLTSNKNSSDFSMKVRSELRIAFPVVTTGLSPQNELNLLKQVRLKLVREKEKKGSGRLPKAAIISDQHGGIDKFDSLIVDAIRSVFPKKVPADFVLNHDRNLSDQLSAIGITYDDLSGKIFFHNLGDFMDRGRYGVKVWRRSAELMRAGLSSFVIGNHDFWMFMNLLGFHLPWYEGYNFYDYKDSYDQKYGNVEELVRKKHETENDTRTKSWWAARASEYTKFYDAWQKKRWAEIDIEVGGAYDGDKRAKGSESLYAKVAPSLEGNKEFKKLWDKFRGWYQTDIYTGTRAVGHMSLKWWQELQADFEKAYATIEKTDNFDPELPANQAWRRALAIIEEIMPEVQQQLEDQLAEGKWWWRVFEAINYQNYTSPEWWAKDWIFHKGWGMAVIKELNEGNTDLGQMVTDENYFDNAILGEIGAFLKRHFSLYERDIYGNTYMHAFLPVDMETGEFHFTYKDVEYRGKTVWAGLDLIAKDVREKHSLKEFYEAFALVNSWYADNTTKLKVPDVAAAINKFGPALLAERNGFTRLFIGHLPFHEFSSKLKTAEQRGIISGFNVKDTIFFTDHGMDDKFGGRGGWIEVSPVNGIQLSGFEHAGSGKIVVNPRTVETIQGTDGPTEKVLFHNPPFPRIRSLGDKAAKGPGFLATVTRNVNDRIAQLENAADARSELRNPNNNISRLGLGHKLEGVLRLYGINTIPKLKDWSRLEIRRLPGIGPQSLDRIQEALHGIGASLRREKTPSKLRRSELREFDNLTRDLLANPQASFGAGEILKDQTVDQLYELAVQGEEVRKDQFPQEIMNDTVLGGLEEKKNKPLRELKIAQHQQAAGHAFKTKSGSSIYYSNIMNRSAKLTEHLEIEGFQVDTDQKAADPAHAAKVWAAVQEFLKGKELIQVDRSVGENPNESRHFRLLVSKEFGRLAHELTSLHFAPKENAANLMPDLLTIDLPDFDLSKYGLGPKKQPYILRIPSRGIALVLGADYFGEIKKSALTMNAYLAKLEGNLSIHAGSKIVKVRDAATGQIVLKRIAAAGLSGTGKSTSLIGKQGLGTEDPEEASIVKQDDFIELVNQNPGTDNIVISKVKGLEEGYYYKTERLDPDKEPELHRAADYLDTILTNVWMNDEEGLVPDYNNVDVSGNGRGVVKRARVIADIRDRHAGDSAINIDSVDMDGLDVVIWLTRRETIVPPAVVLNAAQAAAYFALGESVITSAADPARAGQSTREFGFSPFIMGSNSAEANFILKMAKSNPKMQFILLNTGSVGATYKNNSYGAKPREGVKIGIQDSAAFLKSIFRGNFKTIKDPDWGYDVITEVPGHDVSKFDPRKYYSPEVYRKMVADLRKERLDWLERFPGLDPEIIESIKAQPVEVKVELIPSFGGEQKIQVSINSQVAFQAPVATYNPEFTAHTIAASLKRIEIESEVANSNLKITGADQEINFENLAQAVTDLSDVLNAVLARSELRAKEALNENSITHALMRYVESDELDLFGGLSEGDIAKALTQNDPIDLENKTREKLDIEIGARLFTYAQKGPSAKFFQKFDNLAKAVTIIRQSLVAARLIPDSLGEYMRFSPIGHRGEGIFQITLTNYQNANALSLPRVQEETRILNRIEHIAQERNKRGLKTAWVTTNEGAFFAAGADLTVFNELSTKEPEAITQYALQYSVPNWIKRKELWEKEGVLSIAALSRPALGGGAELPLEFTLRVMDQVKGGIGQPESKLGLLAGAGGVVYLPRLVGPMKALTILLSGGTVSPRVAKDIGWVDVLAPEGETLSTSAEIARSYVHSMLDAKEWLRQDYPNAKSNSTWEELREQSAGTAENPSQELQLVKELFGKINVLLTMLDLVNTEVAPERVKKLFSNKHKQSLIEWAKSAPQSAELQENLINLIEVSFAMVLREATRFNKDTKQVEKIVTVRIDTLRATFRTVIAALENPDVKSAHANVMHVFGHELVASGKGEGAQGIRDFNNKYRVPDARPDILAKLAGPETLTKTAGVRYWLWLLGVGNDKEQEEARRQLAHFGAERVDQIRDYLGLNSNSFSVPSLRSEDLLVAFVVDAQPKLSDGQPYFVPVDGGVNVQIVTQKEHAEAGTVGNFRIFHPLLELVAPEYDHQGKARGTNAKQLEQFGSSFRYVALKTKTTIDQAIKEIADTGVEYQVVLVDKEKKSTLLLNAREGYKIQFVYFPRLDATLGIFEPVSETRSDYIPNRSELRAVSESATLRRAITEIPVEGRPGVFKVIVLGAPEGQEVFKYTTKESLPPEARGHWDAHRAVYEFRNERLGYVGFWSVAQYLAHPLSMRYKLGVGAWNARGILVKEGLISEETQAIDAYLKLMYGQWGLGGMRIKGVNGFKTETDAMTESMDLGDGMGHKASGAQTSTGGGKFSVRVTQFDPSDKANDALVAQVQDDLIRTFDQFQVGITAIDVGTGDAHIQRMAQTHPSAVIGTGDAQVGYGGIIPSPETAHGTVFGMLAAVEVQSGETTLNNQVIAIKGAGKVGQAETELLLRSSDPKERAKQVIIGEPVENIRQLLKNTYAKEIEEGRLVILDDPETIWDLKVDIQSPATAEAHFITKEIVDRVYAANPHTIFAGASNIQLATRDIGEYIHEKGMIFVPDYIINSGGLIAVVVHLVGFDLKEHISGIYETVREILWLAKDKNISTLKAAEIITEKRIEDDAKDVRHEDSQLAVAEAALLREKGLSATPDDWAEIMKSDAKSWFKEIIWRARLIEQANQLINSTDSFITPEQKLNYIEFLNKVRIIYEAQKKGFLQIAPSRSSLDPQINLDSMEQAVQASFPGDGELKGKVFAIQRIDALNSQILSLLLDNEVKIIASVNGEDALRQFVESHPELGRYLGKNLFIFSEAKATHTNPYEINGNGYTTLIINPLRVSEFQSDIANLGVQKIDVFLTTDSHASAVTHIMTEHFKISGVKLVIATDRSDITEQAWQRDFEGGNNPLKFLAFPEIAAPEAAGAKSELRVNGDDLKAAVNRSELRTDSLERLPVRKKVIVLSTLGVAAAIVLAFGSTIQSLGFAETVDSYIVNSSLWQVGIGLLGVLGLAAAVISARILQAPKNNLLQWSETQTEHIQFQAKDIVNFTGRLGKYGREILRAFDQFSERSEKSKFLHIVREAFLDSPFSRKENPITIKLVGIENVVEAFKKDPSGNFRASITPIRHGGNNLQLAYGIKYYEFVVFPNAQKSELRSYDLEGEDGPVMSQFELAKAQARSGGGAYTAEDLTDIFNISIDDARRALEEVDGEIEVDNEDGESSVLDNADDEITDRSELRTTSRDWLARKAWAKEKIKEAHQLLKTLIQNGTIKDPKVIGEWVYPMNRVYSNHIFFLEDIYEQAARTSKFFEEITYLRDRETIESGFYALGELINLSRADAFHEIQAFQELAETTRSELRSFDVLDPIADQQAALNNLGNAVSTLVQNVQVSRSELRAVIAPKSDVPTAYVALSEFTQQNPAAVLAIAETLSGSSHTLIARVGNRSELRIIETINAKLAAEGKQPVGIATNDKELRSELRLSKTSRQVVLAEAGDQATVRLLQIRNIFGQGIDILTGAMVSHFFNLPEKLVTEYRSELRVSMAA